MKRVCLSIFLLLPFLTYAQVELKGTVVSNQVPVPFANVVLLNQDGTMETGTTSREDGSFFINSPKGTYTIRVGCLGFEDWVQEIGLDKDTNLGTISLREKVGKLEEVTVVGKKRLVERRADRLIFNVENNIVASGGNSLDALRLAPGLRVQNNQISMIGKSEMRVMVNDHIIPLSGEDLENYLTSISADDIKNIEIITNPPAKYQAEGNSGLINIRLKKGAENSWSNTTSGSYTQSTYAVYSLRNNFAYQKNKVRLLLNLSGTCGDTEIVESSFASYPEGSLAVIFDRKDKEDNVSGRVEFDYEIGKNASAGFQYLRNGSTPDSETTATFSVYNNKNIRKSFSITDGLTERGVDNQSVNLHFVSKLDTLGTKVSVDLDYFSFKADEERSFLTKNFGADKEFLGIGLSALSIADQNVINRSAKIDVEHPIRKVELSYGGKISLIKNNSGTNFFNTINSSPALDSALSDEFQYSEKIQAVYVSASTKLRKKWETQLGLRLENTQIEGVSRTLEQTNKNRYLKAFPTFYLSYLLNDNHLFSFNYGKRINRPGYFLLNPFRIYISENSYSTGNPFLQPSFNNNFELSFIFKNSLTSTFFLNTETGGFGALPVINTETDEQIVTRENLFNQNTYGLVESYTLNQIPWWESVNTAYFYSSDTEYPDFELDIPNQSRLSYYFSTNNTFILNKAKNFKGQVNFWYNSPYVYGLFHFAQVYSLDLYLKYNLLQSDLQFSVGVNDLLKTSTNDHSAISYGTTQRYNNYFSNRYFRFTMSYMFGNKKIKSTTRNFGNEDERGRAGN